MARISRSWMTGLCLLAGSLLVAFWSVWFLDRNVLASDHRSEYFTFENAFPLADGWMAVCCFVAAYCLATRRASALLWLIAAGSASAFLTGMDVLYDIENDIYLRGGAAFIEILINIQTAVFAAVCLVWAWQRRADILAA